MRGLILASASPRRKVLLERFGLSFTISPAAIDETGRPDESATELIRRVAIEKAEAVSRANPGHSVLGADTGVILDGHFLGKPADQQDALAMLNALSGRSHEVSSAVVLITPAGERYEAFSTTTVWFASLPEAWIQNYVASGDPMDKAGAYAIQNEAGLFVSRIEGSYSNVVGLPLYETGQLLRQVGLWHPQDKAHQREFGLE